MKNKSCSNLSFKALMITQFLGAFNDNAFKFIITILAVNRAVTSHAGARNASIMGALFIVPFIIFSSYAGYLADRFSKRKITVLSKIAEVVVMCLAFLALMSGNLVFIAFVLFLMATQSTFFSPAKYGILPELLDDANLSKGNGYLQMWTFLAIILGTAAGGKLLHLFDTNIANTVLVFIGLAVAGTISSLFITKVPPSGSKKKFQINALKDTLLVVKEIKHDKALYLTLLAISYFWFLGIVFQLNCVVYANKFLMLPDSRSSDLFVAISIGIGMGSLLAGRWSGKKVEFGLVPLGAIGLSIFCILLGLPVFSYKTILFVLFLLGLASGLFIVPLNAFFQQMSPNEKRGEYLACMNIVTSLAMLAGSLMLFVFGDIFRFTAPQIFLLLGILSVIVTAYIFMTLPDSFVRFCNWLMTHTIYRIKIRGLDNVPKEGGALLVCNHVSYVDHMIISASIQRHIRYMMYRGFYNKPLLKPFCKMMKAIPVSLNDSPKTIIKSLQVAKKAVMEGNLVCIFAEGELTRTGNMLPFSRGFEYIMKDIDAPIIPVYLDRIWGSIFSVEREKIVWTIPKVLPIPVTIIFGQPMPASSKTYQVRIAVQELSTDAFKIRGKDQKKIHIAFIKEAKRHPFKFCMADSTKMVLNYVLTLAGVLTLRKKLFSKKDDDGLDEMIGVLLPASCMASIVNGAILFAGKIPVNLNFTVSKTNMESAIEQCNMKTVITSRIFLKKIKIDENDKMIFLEDIRGEITKKDKFFSAIAAFIYPSFLIEWLFVGGNKYDVNDTATVIFSSGSTGEPKGIMLSHGNIFSNIEAIYQILHLKSNDVIMAALPFFHSFGFTATLCFPVGVGIGVVYHTNPMDAGTIGELTEKYKATIIMGTPTFFSAYVRKCSPKQFESLRLAIVGAEKLKESLDVKFYEKYGIAPFEGYGATELSPIVSMGVPDYVSADKNIHQLGNKKGSVGHPVPGVAVKAVRADTFELLPFGEEGLLLVKGPNVMKGYLNNPQKTSEVIKDGWYVTGDIGCIDENGFIIITDRLSRFSKIGGEMVPHIKIEEEILNIEGSTEQTCVVTSVSDERKGEKLIVLYKNEMNVKAIWEKLNQSTFPKLWIPKKENFYKIESIPVLGTGKLDLREIKELAKKITFSK
ncbi:MAG: MFS transporter [Candidatus Aureabacteria bacterium]|nr:MFS transporter [Candidatus Auribacterota bacterium]